MIQNLCRQAAAGDASGVQRTLAANPELLNARDEMGDSPLAHAARWGRANVAELLLEAGADPNLARDDGWSPLFWACSATGNLELVELLLEAGADANARANHHGAAEDTPLHTPARSGNPEVVDLLIAYGADVNARCGDGDYRYNGFTPLQVAAGMGNHSPARTLLNNGAEMDLFSASALGDVRALRALLSRSPEALESRDSYGASPLHWATRGGNEESARLLVSLDADVNARDTLGRTPLILAAVAGSAPLIDLLVNRGAEIDIFAAAALGDSHRAAELLESNPGLVRAHDDSGWTPLHWATRTGQMGIAHMLLDSGADVNARDSQGRTPLWPAAYDGRHGEIVRLLLERGADPAVQDKSGKALRDYDVGKEISAILDASA